MKNAFRLLVLIGTFASYSVRAQNVPDAFSPVVSYQFEDSLAESGTQTSIISPVVAYQYYDWPGDENLTFQKSPAVSYYYNGMPAILTQPGSQVARVGDPVSFGVLVQGSSPLSYQWYFNNNAIAGATTPNLGFSSVQLAQAGSYSVAVSNQYGRVVSVPAALNVFLPPVGPMPALPNFTVAGSTPPVNLTAAPPPTGSLKKSGQTNRSAMTIVLTHGWRSSPADWPDAMKAALVQNGFGSVNIFEWNWQPGANTAVYNPVLAASRTPAEGEALGRALYSELGAAYNQPIHFVGHSFGTLVNCRAADYLHGDLNNRPASTYDWNNTQLTLFDEAELVQPVNNIYVLTELLFPTRNSTKDFTYKAIPATQHYNWIDNYVSEVGILHPEAANVMLWRRWAVPGISDFVGTNGLHGYASVWYQNTIKSPVITMGHQWSFERNTMGSGARPKGGSYFTQSFDLGMPPTSLSPLSPVLANSLNAPQTRFVAYPLVTAYQGLYTTGVLVQNAAVSSVQYAGGVIANIASSFSPLNGEPIYTGTAGSTPAYVLPATLSNTYQANWDLNIKMQPGTSQVQSNNRSLHFTASQEVAAVPYVSIPVTIPSGAVGLSFEFMVENAADTDFMTMAIDSENYFTMEASYIDQGKWNGVPVMDVSALAGQQVNLLFALNGTNGPSGNLQVRGIQFYIPPAPALTLQMTGGHASLSWPISAVGWTLELTTDLSDANSWQAVNGAPNDSEYFHSITFDLGTSTRAFFRLKK